MVTWSTSRSGDGHVPWEAVFGGLRDVNFKGPVAFESFTTENVVLARAACLWRDVVGDGSNFVSRAWKQMSAAAKQAGYELPGRLRAHD